MRYNDKIELWELHCNGAIRGHFVGYTFNRYILESISCKFAGDKEIFRGDAIYENSRISFTGENM
mgnify:FL=1